MVAPLFAGAALGIAADAILAGETLSGTLIRVAGTFGAALEEGNTEVMIPVDSEAIAAIGYSVGQVITVRFRRGGTYEYPGSEAMFIAFLLAPSKGRFFNDHFR